MKNEIFRSFYLHRKFLNSTKISSFKIYFKILKFKHWTTAGVNTLG